MREVLHDKRRRHSIQHSPFIRSSALSTSSVSKTTYRPATGAQIVSLAEIGNEIAHDQVIVRHSWGTARSARYVLLGWSREVGHIQRAPIVTPKLIHFIPFQVQRTYVKSISISSLLKFTSPVTLFTESFEQRQNLTCPTGEICNHFCDVL